jgi:hypothetical protein
MATHSLWWLLGQFAIVVVGGAVMIAAVIAIWYGLAFVVLGTIGRLFPLRGWKLEDRPKNIGPFRDQ